MADAHSRLAPPAAAIEAKAKPLFLPVLLASLSLNLAYVLRDAHAFAAQPATMRYSVFRAPPKDGRTRQLSWILRPMPHRMHRGRTWHRGGNVGGAAGDRRWRSG